MRSVRRTLIEALVLVVLACAVGLAGNAVRKKGLDLGRDYFRTTSERAVVSRVGASGLGDEAPDEEPLLSAEIRTVTLDEASAYFNDPAYDARSSQTRYVFVDARDDANFTAGHIPGAKQIDHYHKEQYLLDVLAAAETAEKLIVYCNGGDCTDSKYVLQDLMDEGVAAEKLLLFEGGWEAWEEAGLPVRKGAY